MSRKRRMFDIALPEEDTPAVAPVAEPDFPAGKVARGPMAAAIAETMESTRDRARIEAQIRAENDALAQEHVRLKRAGLITDLIPLEEIHTDKLIRDRAPGDDADLAELVTSIRDLGLSNPIQIEPREEGGYELIQGWRRLSAFRVLLEQTGDAARWGRIPAGIAARGEALERLYRRMVDENMVRKDISFAEMAQLAIAYADDPQTVENDSEKAVSMLFGSAGYQKRSYIRSFIVLVRALDGAARHLAQVPRALGLSLVQRLGQEPALAGVIRGELDAWPERTATDELGVLRRHASASASAAHPREGGGEAARPGVAAAPVASGKARTSFQLVRPQGTAKCSAANGRLEIRLARDFTTIDRRRLEEAVAALLDRLG